MAPPSMAVTKKDGDFYWSPRAEPHAARKRDILSKHGKAINTVMGPEWTTKYITVAVVAFHLWLGIFVAPTLSWPAYFAVAYVIGATATHNLFLAVHEITHNLAFRKPWMNDALALIANIPIVLPYAMMFKTYHAEHHRYQGWDGVDTDIPHTIEAALLSNFVGKIFFLTFQVFFYALRPCLVRPIKIELMHIINYAFILPLHAAIFWAYGPQPAIFWLLCAFLACSFHPMAGHFLSEHYIFEGAGEQETFSYYGPLNFFGWNVGYHNEHHDFPNVAGRNLPKVRALAAEFYDDLRVTKSWPGALWDFLTTPSVSSYSRVKRERDAWKREKLIPTQ